MINSRFQHIPLSYLVGKEAESNSNLVWNYACRCSLCEYTRQLTTRARSGERKRKKEIETRPLIYFSIWVKVSQAALREGDPKEWDRLFNYNF